MDEALRRFKLEFELQFELELEQKLELELELELKLELQLELELDELDEEVNPVQRSLSPSKGSPITNSIPNNLNENPTNCITAHRQSNNPSSPQHPIKPP
jgi:hypothetical protein